MLASGSLDKVKACVNLSELIKDPEHNMLVSELCTPY